MWVGGSSPDFISHVTLDSACSASPLSAESQLYQFYYLEPTLPEPKTQ